MGNRFYPALYRAGITSRLIDASAGLAPGDREYLIGCGIGITALVPRAPARCRGASCGTAPERPEVAHDRRARQAASSCRSRYHRVLPRGIRTAIRTAIEPSPMAVAARLTDPLRTSPTARAKQRVAGQIASPFHGRISL
jgi:hypothetical protein